MAFKITKSQMKELGDFAEDIGDCWRELEDVTNSANERIKAILAEVTTKRAEYEGKVEDAKRLADGIADDLRSEFDDKSENWQEGERGQVVDEWIDELFQHFSEAEDVSLDDELESFEIEVPNDVSHLFEAENFNDEPSF